MHLFIGGFSIKEAIQTCKYYIQHKQRPILNYAIESIHNKNKIASDHTTFHEYCSIIEHHYRHNSMYNDTCVFDIALKYSSLHEPVSHMNAIASLCKKKKMKLFVDAENVSEYYTYKTHIHDAILRFNKNAYVIYKTYQMYRKDALYELQNDVDFFKMKDCYLGIKLVRGAYFHQDKNSNQLFLNKEETDQQYNDALMYLYDKMSHNSKLNIHTIVASHNTTSCELAIIFNRHLSRHHQFSFAHLQGMSEKNAKQYTHRNQKVYVYIPYGPIQEIIPYLSRRAYENIDMFLPKKL